MAKFILSRKSTNFIIDCFSHVVGQSKKNPLLNWLQNTFFFCKKYKVDLILFANHSGHTSNNKIIFFTEKSKLSLREGQKTANLISNRKMANLTMDDFWQDRQVKWVPVEIEDYDPSPLS